MNIAAIGSRSFNDYNKLKEVLDTYLGQATRIVSGGAKGADTLAERWAKENNIPTQIFYPDWNKHGKSAGIIRNKEIIKNADIVIAFWDGESKGTKHSISIAKQNGKELVIIKTKS